MIRTVTSVLLLISIAAAAPAYSAAYMKFDGVKGESKGSENPNPLNNVKSNETAQPAGLLLPAVQKAREADRAQGKKKGNVEYEWKIEAGEK